MPRPATLGVITKSSARPVPATLERLRAAVEERGLIVFALVDHSGEAGKAGLSMPNTKLLVFGSPAAGTPIMLAARISATTRPVALITASVPWE